MAPCLIHLITLSRANNKEVVMKGKKRKEKRKGKYKKRKQQERERKRAERVKNRKLCPFCYSIFELVSPPICVFTLPFISARKM